MGTVVEIAHGRFVPAGSEGPSTADLAEFVSSLSAGHLHVALALIASRLTLATQPHQGRVGGNLLNVREAADRLRLSADYIYRNKKNLPFVRHVGRKVLCDPAAMDRWLSTRR